MKSLRHPLPWGSFARRCPRSGRRWPTGRGLGCLLGWLLLVCAPTAQALKADKRFADYVLDAWSIQDGLPQISALALAQDRTGYLWVGTQSGLARFDGVRFVTYAPEDTPALSGIWIRSLLADRSGRLWVGTYKGLAVREGGRFRAIPAADPARYPLLDVFALARQADGSLVAGTSEGVFRVAGGKLVRQAGPATALALLPRRDGLWVGTDGAVERIANARVVRLPLPADAARAAVTRLADTQGLLWAGTSQGLYRLAVDGWRPVVTGTPLDRSPITAMFTDRDGNLWIGSNAGLGRFRSGSLTEFVADTQPGAFPQVTAGMEDREGNLWLGSQLNGLARLWNGWTRRYGIGDGLHDPIVWSLSPAVDGTPGRIWVGTNNGLSLFDQGRFQLVAPGSALPHPQAYNILAEPGQVWIGTRHGLVVLRDGTIVASPKYAPMAGTQINGIVRAPDGSLWFPTSDGLFHEVGGTLTRIGQAQGLPDPRVRVIAFDRGGRLLLGTQSGLWQLRNGRVERVEGAGLPATLDISALLPLRDGRLVVGTLSERLFVRAGGRWRMLGPAQGMPSNAPFYLTEDGRGWLWVAGIRGVSRVRVSELPTAADPVTRPVRGDMVLNERGDANAGQQGFCCNGAGLSKGFRVGNVLWLPSRAGMVALDTADIVRNPLPPALVIERVRTAQGWQDVQAKEGPLVLPASARDLGFEFTALSFQDPRSVQLRYRLLGYDRTWHRLDDPRQRRANYTNLPPGDYSFQVMGANNAGVWSPQAATLRFSIQPLFRETWLFATLLLALLLVLMYAGYRYQMQRHSRQRLALEAQVHDRTRELHAANARLENASQTDPLTGLRNRRYLANQIPADLAYYDRERSRNGEYGQVLVFAMVDLDFFKRVNDVQGHRAGDQVLMQVAQVLGSVARSSDYLARWGGEEFLLVFRPMAGRHLDTIGQRIRAALSGHDFDIGTGAPLRLTGSVGLSEYPLFRDAQQGLGWEQMVELADAALYWVKQHGRDGWAAFRPTGQTQLSTLMRDLQLGVDELLRGDRLQLLTSLTQPAPPGTAHPP